MPECLINKHKFKIYYVNGKRFSKCNKCGKSKKDFDNELDNEFKEMMKRYDNQKKRIITS